ncbi:MAG: hypothetical protein M0Z91_10050 [Actinomycetota bacterium]|nr:hypothetical protein [Actinomycetota bacterium]
MAQIQLAGNQLLVELSALEKIEGIHSSLRFPLIAVRAVRVTDNPYAEISGIRIGTGIPPVVAVGTWIGVGHKSFVAVHGHRAAVVIELKDQSWDELIISSDDAQSEAERIQAALRP